MDIGVSSETTVVSGVLTTLAPPGELCLIAKGYCGAIIAALLLKLPIKKLFVDLSLMMLYEPLLQGRSVEIESVDRAPQAYFDVGTVVIVHASVDFFTCLHERNVLRSVRWVIWIPNLPSFGLSFKSTSRLTLRAQKECRRFDLSPLLLKHSDYGGATTGRHVLGFSSAFNLGSSSFSPPPNVSRSIRHFWKPAEQLRNPVHLGRRPPALTGDFKRPVNFKDCLRIEGLLPVSHPYSTIVGPSVFFPGQAVRRVLTHVELMSIFDVPSLLLDVFKSSSQWSTTAPMPFMTSISPVIMSSVFRELWGSRGGTGFSSVGAEASTSLESSPGSGPPTHLSDMAFGSGSHHSTLSSADDSADLSSSVSDLCEDSTDSSSTGNSSTDIPDLCDRSFDTSSAGDSFMPRKTEKSPHTVSDHDWEFLDDVSVCTTAAESECTSTGSVSIEVDLPTEEDSRRDPQPTPKSSSDSSFSVSTVSEGGSSLSSSTSIASEATLRTKTSTSSNLPGPTTDTLKSIRDTTIGKKAVKADDAAVPEFLWNDRIHLGDDLQGKKEGLTGFRAFGLQLFRRALYLDCMEYLEMEYGADWRELLKSGKLKERSADGKLTQIGKELDAVRGILWHANETNWFEYLAGSRLHHFRFPIRYRKEARDGTRIYFETEGPSSRQRQPDIPPEMLDQVREKIKKVIKRRYMTRVTTEWDIKSLIKFFAVPKGERDIRMVYDATASGLNAAVWAPTFWLPTINTLVRSLDSSSWMTDRDMGDMFLNFPLHEMARPFAGVDIKPILTGQEAKKYRWYQWVRNAMGFAPSPYNSIKMALIAEEVIRGDRMDVTNPFHWSEVRMNLPGSSTYDPTRSWIMKFRSDGLSACDFFTFVDDERIKGPTEDLTWRAAHTMAAKQAYLGIQDAARKADKCTQQPRAWAGAVVHVTQDEGVCVLTSEEKWTKMKKILKRWHDEIANGAEELDHKEFLSDRGFLVYVTQAYPALVPYMKGFHLTAEMWRGNRDEDGWKLPPAKAAGDKATNSFSSFMSRDEDEAALGYSVRKQMGDSTISYAPPTGRTKPAPRLIEDLKALLLLTSSELPPLRIARPNQVMHVYYGFGDASGSGRGSTLQGFRPSSSTQSTDLKYRVGVWGADVDSESSNFRELCNLVEDLESEAKEGTLNRCEMFLFTDNSTAESAFYKGSSSSKKLHALVLRLHKLTIEHSMLLHLVHVSGTRMIAQGTDGCSRGVLMEGVMAGNDMLSYVDLDKTAVERSPTLLPWIRSWCGHADIKPLTPAEWFQEGHGIIGGHKDKHGVWIPDHEPSNRMHLWAPPPAVADAMLEELLKARHKRTDTYHIIVIPRLMAPRWRRLFHKASDLFFAVDPGNSFWPSDMYEPLFIGIVFPFIPHRPWCLKRAPAMVGMGREMRRLCKEGDVAPGRFLRKLLKLPRWLARVSPSVALGVLHMPG